MADDDDKVVRVDFGRATTTDAPPDPSAERKRDAFAGLIEAGLVLVSLDTRVAQVSVPPHHVGDPQLGLHFSYRFQIDDFVWDDVGVRASLSFGGEPFFCEVPWAAVFLLRSQVTGDAFIFPESVPEELAHLVDVVQKQLADGEEPSLVAVEEAPGLLDGETVDAPSSGDEPGAAAARDDAAAADDPSEDDPSADDPSADEHSDDEPPPRGGPRLTLVKG